MDFLTKAISYLKVNEERFLEELKEICTIPSVSTSPAHETDMLKTAETLAAHMRRIGLSNVQVIATQRHPVVYGESLAGKPGQPVVLVYGHYDVQPAEPLELWRTPAFEPTLRGDELVARGASDMKGQVMASLNAVEALLQNGPLPVNVKFMIEGEEEIGSPSLPKFLRDHKELLACDVVFNPDAGMISPECPTIVYGLRGLAYFELRVSGPEHDLHSGVFGGVVHNPAQALCELVAGMHDAEGRITLPGFYDSVAALDSAEREEMASLPVDEAYYQKQAGVPALWGEAGFSAVERVGGRPSLDVNGIYSGFTGSGSKTVIPAAAMAKISMRLVPNQRPDEVYEQFIAYLEKKAPPTIRWELIPMPGGPACMVSRDLPAVTALEQALKTVWQQPVCYKREGGSVPVVTEMQEILNVESVLTGFGLPDDQIHGPNERLHLPTWRRGTEALVHFFINMGQS
ncbi:MAG TPA: dipeptidase [Anaerolineaceae bacterium]|nr:dipeptidase [Anaerolineaceae bacterium]HPN53289.1 dipeptidase [Anaerolineaceae bacterium]